MRFEEAYGGWQSRRLTQEEAARVLGGVSARSGATWTATRARDTTGWWTSTWARSRRGAPRSTRCCAPRRCTASATRDGTSTTCLELEISRWRRIARRGSWRPGPRRAPGRGRRRRGVRAGGGAPRRRPRRRCLVIGNIASGGKPPAPSALQSGLSAPQRRERRSPRTTDLEPSQIGARRSRTTPWGEPQRRSSKKISCVLTATALAGPPMRTKSCSPNMRGLT